MRENYLILPFKKNSLIVISTKNNQKYNMKLFKCLAIFVATSQACFFLLPLLLAPLLLRRELVSEISNAVNDGMAKSTLGPDQLERRQDIRGMSRSDVDGSNQEEILMNLFIVGIVDHRLCVMKNHKNKSLTRLFII